MRLQNVILLMGPPGSGKGTQSKLLVDKLGYAYFSMGDTLREYSKMDTELGKEIKKTIDQGIIVTDEITKRIFADKFNSILDAAGLVLDGYPRTMGQLEVLSDLINRHNIPFKVIFLDVDKQKLIDRLALRSKVEGRVDDADLIAVEKRFDEYMAKTAPVKNSYEEKGMVTHINGDQSVDEVHKEIVKSI